MLTHTHTMTYTHMTYTHNNNKTPNRERNQHGTKGRTTLLGDCVMFAWCSEMGQGSQAGLGVKSQRQDGGLLVL